MARYPYFVDQNQSNRRQVDYCDRCKEPIPGGEHPSDAPIQLEPNEAAHQTLRWRTAAAKDSPACIQTAWISVSSEDMKHVFLLVTPSLIKPVCSSVDVVGYLPGLSALPAQISFRGQVNPDPGQRVFERVGWTKRIPGIGSCFRAFLHVCPSL
jgi:hypothetical protein